MRDSDTNNLTNWQSWCSDAGRAAYHFFADAYDLRVDGAKL